MMFVTVVGVEGVIKTYGNNDLVFLLNVAFSDIPHGVSFRIVSKNMILRMEFLSLDPYVLTFTNIDKSRHSYVIRMMLDKMDQDEQDIANDDETEIDLT